MQIHMHNLIKKTINTISKEDPPASPSICIKILTVFCFQNNFHIIVDKGFSKKG
jgi:hypothetical protein